jgi:glutamate synthase (NADPH/NADH)
VTNPAIDPLREAVVTSLRCFVGPERDITCRSAEHAARLDLMQPILSMEEMEAVKNMKYRDWTTKVGHCCSV